MTLRSLEGTPRLTMDDDEPHATNASGGDTFLRALARSEPRPPPSARGAGERAGREPERLFGQVVDGKYRIDALLGRGGMGTVYLATHVGTGREVALKVLAEELTANDAAVERFRREARTAGQMRHPNVVDVTDFGFAERGGERLAYLVMERLRGTTLRAVLEAEKRLSLDATVDVLDQVCAAVAEAHRLGVLHRDLKPENIHLEPGARGRYRVKVFDFGIAKLMDSVSDRPLTFAPQRDAPPTALALAETLPGDPPQGAPAGSLTRLGAAIGTPRYMSPEQWLGRAVDARTDVYSLGVVAYEMLAGETPFAGHGWSIAAEHAEQAPPPLAEKAPSVPRKIARVVEAALAKDPAARPPTAAAFAAALHAQTETTGTLLRRSIALCADHYARLSRHCAPLTVWPLALAAVGVVCARLAHHGVLSAQANHWILIGTASAAYVVMMLLYAPVGGLLAPVVADLLANQGSVRPPPSAAELGRALRDSLVSTFITTVVMVLVGVVAVLPVAVLATRFAKEIAVLILAPTFTVLYSAIVAPFAVCAQVVAVERRGGFRPLVRSMKLLGAMWRPAFGVLLFYTFVGQIVPEVVVLAARELALRASPAAASAFDEMQSRWLVLYLFNAVFMPFLLAPQAMLYLRAREAEGTPLQATAPAAAG